MGFGQVETIIACVSHCQPTPDPHTNHMLQTIGARDEDRAWHKYLVYHYDVMGGSKELHGNIMFLSFQVIESICFFVFLHLMLTFLPKMMSCKWSIESGVVFPTLFRLWFRIWKWSLTRYTIVYWKRMIPPLFAGGVGTVWSCCWDFSTSSLIRTCTHCGRCVEWLRIPSVWSTANSHTANVHKGGFGYTIALNLQPSCSNKPYCHCLCSYMEVPSSNFLGHVLQF